jgi:hypothetical protein
MQRIRVYNVAEYHVARRVEPKADASGDSILLGTADRRTAAPRKLRGNDGDVPDFGEFACADLKSPRTHHRRQTD